MSEQSNEKTKEVTDQILKKEGVQYERLYRIDDWLLNPETAEWTNYITGEIGRGIYQLIKKVRFKQ